MLLELPSSTILTEMEKASTMKVGEPVKVQLHSVVSDDFKKKFSTYYWGEISNLKARSVRQLHLFDRFCYFVHSQFTITVTVTGMFDIRLIPLCHVSGGSAMKTSFLECLLSSCLCLC